MGACGSRCCVSPPKRTSVSQTEQKGEGALSGGVELELLHERIQDLFKWKVLLLGAGESGKSTVVKQLKLIHKTKLTPEELRLTAISLHINVVDCMKALFNAARKFGYSFTPEEIKLEDSLNSFGEGSRLTPEMGVEIRRVFKGEAIQKTYQRRAEFWLLDSFPYYMDNLDRFCEEGFLPTEEDAVMARIRTTGIVVSELEQKLVRSDEKDKDKEGTLYEPDKLQFQVVDVGGQRNERKKWMHCFDDVKAILFIVNLAGYNQVLFEDNSKNRMHEELELFQQVTHNKVFQDTPVFLFLNKKDLFESMVLEVDMKHAFPEYTGGLNLKNALDFIESQFKARLPPNKTVHVEMVAARHKRDIKAAFEEVKKALYDMNKKPLSDQVIALKKEHKAIHKQQIKAEKRGGGCFNCICCSNTDTLEETKKRTT